MTKPRSSIGRELFGILGSSKGATDLQARWNRFFREQGMDASMERYPANTRNLPERLSEMFHFDRRGYVVNVPLQRFITPLLDLLDDSAKRAGGVDTVLNRGGVLVGYFLDGVDTARMEVWRSSLSEATMRS